MSEAIWPIVALVLAASTLGSGWAAPKVSRLANALSWLALASGFAVIQFTDAGLAAVGGVAAIAGLAATRCMSDDAHRRWRVAAAAVIVPVAVAVVALVSVRDVTTAWSGQIVVFAAIFAAMVAAASSLLAAAVIRRRPISSSIPVVGLGVVGGLWLAATGRSSLPDAFYGFPLRSGDEPLRWVLSPVEGFEGGLQLAVAAPVPEFVYGLGTIAALLAAGLVVSIWRPARRKITGSLFAAAGVVATGLTVALPTVVSGLRMPGPEAYSDYVKRLLLAGGPPRQRTSDAGAFGATDEITVAMADLAPEIFALTLLIGLCLLAAVLTFGGGESDFPDVESAFGRDYLVRGVAFAWLSWFVAMVAHDGFLGVPGLGAPGEWAFVGFLLITSGLMLSTWAPKSKVARLVADLTPGAALAALSIVAGLAWRFGALPAISLGIF